MDFEDLAVAYLLGESPGSIEEVARSAASDPQHFALLLQLQSALPALLLVVAEDAEADPAAVAACQERFDQLLERISLVPHPLVDGPEARDPGRRGAGSVVRFTEIAEAVVAWFRPRSWIPAAAGVAAAILAVVWVSRDRPPERTPAGESRLETADPQGARALPEEIARTYSALLGSSLAFSGGGGDHGPVGVGARAAYQLDQAVGREDPARPAPPIEDACRGGAARSPAWAHDCHLGALAYRLHRDLVLAEADAKLASALTRGAAATAVLRRASGASAGDGTWRPPAEVLARAHRIRSKGTVESTLSEDTLDDWRAMLREFLGAGN